MHNELEQYIRLIKLYEQGQINQQGFAQQSNLSERQVRRILKRYKSEGIIGLQHKGKNKPSNHHIDRAKKEQIISLICDKYYDCGASYASELLEEDNGIKTNRETLRLWMKQEQLLIKQRKRRPIANAENAK